MSPKFSIRIAFVALTLLGGGCDSGGDAPADANAAAPSNSGSAKTGSALATKAGGRVEEITKALANGENVKFKCVGALSSLSALQTSSEADDKKAYAELQHVCFVEQPKALIAGIRQQISDGETLKSTVAVDLKTVIAADEFPTEGEPAKIATDARRVMDVEIPVHQLQQHLAKAKEEKAAGKRVSMGCIKAKQIVTKSSDALQEDSAGQEALAAYKTACEET